MANTIRLKRRATGGGEGAPSTLENAETAFNEQTNILYYGTGTGGSGGSATSIIPIAGNGAFADLTSAQTIAGVKTFSSEIVGGVSGNAGTATALATGRTVSVTGDMAYTSGSFTGAANVTGTGTLATVNANVGTHTKITINAKGLATAGSQASLSDLAVPTGSIAFNAQLITGLADPVSAQDAATKIYVDSVAQGLDVKASVVAGTTANITLSGAQTIDGISLIAGDRCLVKNQTTQANNGIYLVASGAWTRTTDMDAWSEVPGAFTFVEQGTTQADSGWVCTSNAGGTLGTTAITWSQFSSAGAFTAGTGLTLTGNEFSLTNPVAVNLGGTGVTTSTGSDNNVLSTSPTLVTPALGTPSALVGTNITGTASGLTAGNVTTNANLTGAITSTGNATSLGSFNSAALSGALTDETGSGVAVFATSPTLVTPALGTPSALVLTNATGLPMTTGVTGILPVANGGFGASTLTGYVIGNGSSAMTASATIPTSNITGLADITINGGTY